MRARTSAVVRAGGRLGPLHCEPPLTLRRVHAPDRATCALCLVGTAAGPLAGDDLELDLQLDAGALATLAATGASIAQGPGAEPATQRWTVTLGAGAALSADPGPLIVCADSRVDVALTITLDDAAHVEWTETVVLGRSTDAAPGAATVSWDVTRAGRPLLRQRLDLTEPHGLAPLGGHRVIASTLLTGPDVKARTVVASNTAVAQRIDENSILITGLGDSTAQVSRDLRELRAHF